MIQIYYGPIFGEDKWSEAQQTDFLMGLSPSESLRDNNIVRSMKLRSCILTHEFFLLQELSIYQQNMSPWSQKYNVLVHNLAHYEITGWAKKNEATLHFREYPAVYFPEYLANFKW